MCSRIWDNPAPRCWSSSMLPVEHHACTLATGALRSSWTIIVSPLGKIHLCAEVGGNVMTAEGSVEAALRLTIINNRTVEKNFASGMRAIEVTSTASQRSVIADHFLEAAGLGAGNSARARVIAVFSGANGFTKTSLKS